MEKSIHVVVGEDLESSEEEFDRSESLIAASRSNNNSAIDGNVIQGEAPESDLDVDDFGSTVSLTSSYESAKLAGFKTEKDKSTNIVQVERILSPAEKLKARNPALYKKHFDRNKSLRSNIADKFLHPVINQDIKKMDRLSQNLSNSQMQMQEALLQARLTTGNLLQLQKELEYLIEKDYLSDVKVLDMSNPKVAPQQ